MSSDVYIDFVNPSTGEEEAYRVGHLGTMSYFGYDILSSLRRIRATHPVTDRSWAEEWWVRVSYYEHCVEQDKKLSEEAFGKKYGYVGPGQIDWYDAPYVEEGFHLLEDYPGWRWGIRVD